MGRPQQREWSPSAWVVRRKVWTRSILVVRHVRESVHLEVVVLRKRRTVFADGSSATSSRCS